MIALSSPIFIVFAISALIAFLAPFTKEKIYQKLSFAKLPSSLLPFAIFLLPFVLLFIAANNFGVAVKDTLPYFLGTSLLSFILARIGFSAKYREILLLVLVVVLTLMGLGNLLTTAISLLVGLLAAKLAENIYFSEEESTAQDVLPSIYWLVGMLWITNYSNETINHIGLLLGTIAVVIFFRTIQPPFHNDRAYTGRIVLSATAGLTALLVINKLLLMPKLATMAYLVGAGVFVAYLLDSLTLADSDSVRAIKSIKALVLIGLMTLVATRIFGIFGLIVLAPTTLMASKQILPQCAGLFFIGRVLLQVFIVNFNTNVSGINIMHTYCNAAQYAGFALAFILLVLLSVAQNKKLLLYCFSLIGIIVPIFSNYFLHSEPTSSLMVAISVSATMLAIIGPVFKKELAGQYINLLLMPILIMAISLLSNGLLDMGNQATINSKLTLLAYSLVALIILSALTFWCSKKCTAKAV